MKIGFLGLILLQINMIFGGYKDFVIVIPSYNNEWWCEENFTSALNQDYPSEHYQIIYINDCSTDQTLAKVVEITNASAKKNIVTIINNTVRKGALQNFYEVINQLCAPHKVVVNLDGDDWLDGVDVLGYLNQVYADANVWLTYGRYRYFPYDSNFVPGATAYPTHVIRKSAFRTSDFRASHLRTYYAWLFQRIKAVDLKDGQGNFYSMCPDLAIMYPMLEMSCERHFCSDRVLCVYNNTNPLNENKVNVDLLLEVAKEIRQKPKYSRLPGATKKPVNSTKVNLKKESVRQRRKPVSPKNKSVKRRNKSSI